MEEPKNTPSSEIDLSDSWTVVNSDDSEENVNAEIGETSDSESLEVLEVEQEEPEQNSQEDFEIGREENDHDEECSKDCNCSFLLEDPLIHLAAIQKERKYVHHPSACINMWLSVVMVIAIAITLGLGIGHYLGSKRFARAKDMIHHLKYENQMLEQELADVMKNKYCESDLHNRVRQLVVVLKQSALPDNYCKSYHFQDKIYTHLIHGNDEDVCYAEENPIFANFFKDYFVNDTVPPVVQWFSYINNGEQTLNFPFEDEMTVNRSYISTKNSDNTSSEVELLPKLEAINDKMYSHFPFSKFNTQLTYLLSLLKKWNKFHENLKLPASDSKTECLARLQNTEHLSEVARTVVPLVSGSSYKVSSENVKRIVANSSNGFCRSKINQCILHEEKLQKKEKKCNALTKPQLLCSLLQRSKKKQGNGYLLGKQRAHRKKDKKPEISQFSFQQNSYKNVEKIKFTYDKKKGNGENGEHSSNMRNYSILNSKRMKKKDKMENSLKIVGSKDSNHKFKYITRKQNINKKEKKHQQSRKPTKKQTHNNLQHLKKQKFKPITKLPKQNNKYDSKEIFKSKDKRHLIRDKDGRKYYEKFSNMKNMNRKNDKNFKKCSNDKIYCKFCLNDKKMTEDKKRYPHSEFGSSKKSYKYKTQNNNNKKNCSENAFCKYSFVVHQKDKNFWKYWKKRSKIYEIHMKEMKILQT